MKQQTGSPVVSLHGCMSLQMPSSDDRNIIRRIGRFVNGWDGVRRIQSVGLPPAGENLIHHGCCRAAFLKGRMRSLRRSAEFYYSGSVIPRSFLRSRSLASCP